MYYLRDHIRPGGPQRFHGFENWQGAKAGMDESVRRFLDEGWTLDSSGPRFAYLHKRSDRVELEMMSPAQVRYQYRLQVPMEWPGGTGYRTWSGGAVW